MNSAMSSEASIRRGLGVAILSQFFLRIAGSAGVLVIGGYIVEFQDRGMPITSVLVGNVWVRWLSNSHLPYCSVPKFRCR